MEVNQNNWLLTKNANLRENSCLTDVDTHIGLILRAQWDFELNDVAIHLTIVKTF